MEHKRVFGSGDRTISLTVLEQPIEKGLVGLVSSPLFERNIGLVEDLTPPEDRNYSYAELRIEALRQQ